MRATEVRWSQIVADNGLESDADPELVEAFGEEEGIGVLTIRSQHLRADGDDLRNHDSGLALKECRYQSIQQVHETLSIWIQLAKVQPGLAKSAECQVPNAQAMTLRQQRTAFNVPREMMHAAGGGQHRGAAGREGQSHQVVAGDHQRGFAVRRDPHDAAASVERRRDVEIVVDVDGECPADVRVRDRRR